MGKPVSKVAEVRVGGPLAPYADAFGAGLGQRGYTPLTRVNELRLMGHVSRWLQVNRVPADRFTPEQVEVFRAAQRAGGHGVPATLRVLAPMLEILRDLGVFPPATASEPVAAGAAEELLASFTRYLLRERGLVASTAAAYAARASRFLQRCAPDGSLTGLGADHVTGAVVAESRALSVGAVQFFVVALRAFLRFAFLEGLTCVDLSAAALGSTGRRHTSLPQGIDQASADALLESCDQDTTVGRRDYAVLITLLRLGLRAGEVARLRLEDIDWRAGQIVVHGKGHRIDRLPMPVDVGEAIAGYLQHARPTGPGTAASREVFLRATAPIAGLDRGGVSFIVRRASVRAGIPAIGAHRLRHTAACRMVSAGVPLTQIGQALRHRSSISTAIYARLDVEALRGLAQPWPVPVQAGGRA
jgi:integrase/recombinase XerD